MAETLPARLPGRSYAAQGLALPAVRAAEVVSPTPALSSSPTWIRPSLRQRWVNIPLSWWTPERVEQTLRSSMAGDLVAQWEIFDLMEDTWPTLAQSLQELKDSVVGLQREVIPYAVKGSKPTEEAQRRARIVEDALCNMTPRSDMDECDLDDTLWHLLDARGKGMSVLEIDWAMRNSDASGTIIAPRSTHWVHPRCYTFDSENDDRLMLDHTAVTQRGQLPASSLQQPASRNLVPLPPNKFIVGVCKARTGSPLNTALLRVLAYWWAAMNFTSEWFLNYAQVFGQPIRWATYDPNLSAADQAKLEDMLENMGSAAWALFPAGTQLELKDAAKSTSENPQYALMQMADKLCTLVIKRQTLTSDVGESGSLAAGKVHLSVWDETKMGVGRWAARILTRDLVRPILLANFGDDRECPALAICYKERLDRKSAAEALKAARDAGLALPKTWAYETLQIPEPAENDDVIEPISPAAPLGAPATGVDEETESESETNDANNEDPEEEPTQAREGKTVLDRISEGSYYHPANELGAQQRRAYAPLVALIENAGTVKEAIAACERYLSELPLAKRADTINRALQLAAADGASKIRN